MYVERLYSKNPQHVRHHHHSVTKIERRCNVTSMIALQQFSYSFASKLEQYTYLRQHAK